MLERQRRRIDNEENLLASSPQLLGDRRLTMEDLEPWFGAGQGSRSDDEVGAAWLAKTLGLDGYNGMAEGLAEEDAQPGVFLQEPAEAPPLEVAPSDQELNAIFGEKNDDDDNDEATASFRAEKKDKEIMTDAKGDARPMVETRSSDSNVIVSQASESDEDDVRLTKDEFKALLKAVEKLQKQAIDKAEEDVEEAEKVAVGVQEKVAEAREEAKEAEEEEEEERQEEEEEGVLTPKPQPVSKEELDNLFEEESEEVKVMFVHC